MVADSDADSEADANADAGGSIMALLGLCPEKLKQLKCQIIWSRQQIGPHHWSLYKFSNNLELVQWIRLQKAIKYKTSEDKYILKRITH